MARGADGGRGAGRGFAFVKESGGEPNVPRASFYTLDLPDEAKRAAALRPPPLPLSGQLAMRTYSGDSTITWPANTQWAPSKLVLIVVPPEMLMSLGEDA